MSDSAAVSGGDGADPTRRDFLRQAALLAGLAAAPRLDAQPAGPGAAPPAAAPASYLSLSPAEAAFTEAMVDIMCPADALTPRGTECGVAAFIDRQLAGAFGHGDRLYLRGPWRTGRPEHGYQLPLTPEQFFKAGVAAAQEACRQAHGRRFEELSAAEADAFLHRVAAGELAAERIPLGEWFNDLVYPLFVQGCYADPVYGGNRDKVFWRMIGYPGLPALNGVNMVKYRGKPYPHSAVPGAIEDFG